MKGTTIVVAALLVWAGIAGAQSKGAQSAGIQSAEIQSGGLALVGAKILPMRGEDLEKGTILIREGKIEGIGPRLSVPDGFERLNLEGRVVMPGMIDLNAYLGAYGELHENIHALTPDIRAADAFNPFKDEVKRARSSGVTTFVLAPRDRNVVGGRTSVVKMPGEDAIRPRFLNRLGPWKISLGQAALQSGRAPTSRAGAVALVRSALENAQPGDALHALIRRETSALIHVQTAAEAERTVALMKAYNLRGCLVNALDVKDAAASLAKAGVAVAFGPYSLDLLDRQLQGAAALAAAGGRVAFVSDAPRTRMADIRVTAVLAVHLGLDRRAALRGLTLTAAELLGVQDRVGSLEAGKDADMVVFSGDPLDLTSSIERVLVDGKTLYIRKKISGKGAK